MDQGNIMRDYAIMPAFARGERETTGPGFRVASKGMLRNRHYVAGTLGFCLADRSGLIGKCSLAAGWQGAWQASLAWPP